MMEWLEQVANWLVNFVHEMGYIGIIVMTFVESSFVPVPAEVTMVPAGYLVQQGKLDFTITLASAILGTVGGAYFNYWLAKRYGREMFIRYGKYLMMTDAKLAKLESFFEKHGAISTFTGRLIPGVRHYISFPAGLARMKLSTFCIYTALGGGIWMLVLLILGYYIGENKELLTVYMPWIKGGVLGVILLIGFGYWYKKIRKHKLAQ